MGDNLLYRLDAASKVKVDDPDRPKWPAALCLAAKVEIERLSWMAYKPASKHVGGCDCGQCVPF